MQKNYDISRYSFPSFDDNLCLKPPLWLVLAMLFLARNLLLPLLISAASMGGAGADLQWLLPRTGSMVWAMAGAVLALLVLSAWVGRKPNSGRLVRWVWRHATAFLIASAALQSLPTVRALMAAPQPVDDVEALWPMTGLVFCAALIPALLLVRRVRDVFADFPSAESN